MVQKGCNVTPVFLGGGGTTFLYLKNADCSIEIPNTIKTYQ